MEFHLFQPRFNQKKTIPFEELEGLYLTYSKSAYGLALKILHEPTLAEDAVQDAFLRFYRNPQNFDETKGSFLNWFLLVVRNVCVDQLRKSRHQRELTLSNFVNSEYVPEDTPDQLAEIADRSLSVEDEVWLKMERENIHNTLKTISDEQRHLIELAFFQGLTHKEIETLTGLPLGTVKSRIRQGLLKLKFHLDK